MTSYGLHAEMEVGVKELLRTWICAIRGAERFVLTFSIHNEGDAIYDSPVVLDNFQWHEYDAVGTTGPLN